MLLGLYAYICYDLFYADLGHASEDFLNQIRLTLSCLVLAFIGYMSGKWMGLQIRPDSRWAVFLRMQGFPMSELRRFKVSTVSVGLCFFVMCFVVVNHLMLSNDSPISFVFILFSVSMASFLTGILRHSRKVTTQSIHLSNSNKIADWRRHQLLVRNMPGRGLMIVAVLGVSSIGLLALGSNNTDATNSRFILIQILALVFGFIGSLGIVTAISSDLPHSWFEKQAGLTHDQWITSWEHVSNALTLLLVIASLFVVMRLGQNIDVTQRWMIPVLAGFPVWMTPSISLQLDGRSRLSNGLVMGMLSLFLGTAVMMTPWAAILLPIVRTQAKSYQQGRFYRA